MQHIQVLVNELDIPIHMHLHETRDEIQHSLREHGQRPLARLERLGLLSPSLIAVHMTQLEEAEVGAFAASGGSLVHAPESNLKLASGYCPAGRLLGLR